MKNKQKLALVMALLLLIVSALSACGQATDAAEPAEELPELKIGVDILKPFYYIDENGDCAGIDAEIAAEACRRAGYSPTFVNVTWSERDTYLESGDVDCLWNAFIKDGREDDYLWTDAYLQSDLRVLVDTCCPDADLKSFNGHAGVAVRAASTAEELLLNSTSSKGEKPVVYACGTFASAATAFIKGYAGALAGHEAVLQDVMRDNPDLYRFLDGTLLTANLGVAFRKEDTSGACEKLNAAIQEMKDDGTIAAIAEKYTSDAYDDGEVA